MEQRPEHLSARIAALSEEVRRLEDGAHRLHAEVWFRVAVAVGGALATALLIASRALAWAVAATLARAGWAIVAGAAACLCLLLEVTLMRAIPQFWGSSSTGTFHPGPGLFLGMVATAGLALWAFATAAVALYRRRVGAEPLDLW